MIPDDLNGAVIEAETAVAAARSRLEERQRALAEARERLARARAQLDEHHALIAAARKEHDELRAWFLRTYGPIPLEVPGPPSN